MPTARFLVDEAAERLEELIDRALLGETVIIEAHNGFQALLQPFEANEITKAPAASPSF